MLLPLGVKRRGAAQTHWGNAEAGTLMQRSANGHTIVPGTPRPRRVHRLNASKFVLSPQEGGMIADHVLRCREKGRSLFGDDREKGGREGKEKRARPMLLPQFERERVE
ncbi:unnamed protein product, partial [Ixodes pacificus]